LRSRLRIPAPRLMTPALRAVFDGIGPSLDVQARRDRRPPDPDGRRQRVTAQLSEAPPPSTHEHRVNKFRDIAHKKNLSIDMAAQDLLGISRATWFRYAAYNPLTPKPGISRRTKALIDREIDRLNV